MNGNNTEHNETEATPLSRNIDKETNIVEIFGPSVRLIDTLPIKNGVDPLAAEQYRILHTKLDQICRERSYRTIAITSAVQGEGKSLTSISLAYAMATEFKKRVILVECDLRRPTLSSCMKGNESPYGLVDVLNEKVTLNEAVTKLEAGSLYFLLAGNNAKNSSELLSSQQMKVVMNELKTKFDYVIIDATPILPMADINVLTKVVDGFILVIRAEKTPKDLVLTAINSLSGGDIVGTVLNGAKATLRKYYY